MKITILEFTPCADAIYRVRRDAREGYLDGRDRKITIQSGAKLRPQMVSTYAGGKATNVARVMDKLLKETDEAEVELIVFRPDSPEGRYIHDLQASALTRVAVTPVIIKGRARLCIDLTDPQTSGDSRVEFNISPRSLWDVSACRVALDFTSRLTSDLLLLAGNPPVIESTGRMASDLYASVIEQARTRTRVVSVDTEKGALAACLASVARPDVIKINADEYACVGTGLWNDFKGALVVTDSGGCRVWEAGPAAASVRVAGAEHGHLYSTIGAGDAVHAGFTLARWVWGFDLVRACRYGQAAAAASVTSPDGTRGITKAAVGRFFSDLERAGA